MDYLDFRLQHYAKEGTHLLKKAKEILQKSNLASLKAFENKIPEKIIKDDEKLKIAFVGQYSAGKSTLLKVLTGIDSIETGSGITTQKTSHYDWNGIEVWDTPGIQTGVREDHDEITNKAIAESDLIVFLVTNELFDDKLADYFRNLAIEKEKGHESNLSIKDLGKEMQVQQDLRVD